MYSIELIQLSEQGKRSDNVKFTKIKITGDNVTELIEMFVDDDKFYTFQPSDDVYVFTGEEYYVRNNSQLMACIIAKVVSQHALLIDIISGGGKVGLFRVDSGAEAHWVKTIAETLEKIVTQKSWHIEKNL